MEAEYIALSVGLGDGIWLILLAPGRPAGGIWVPWLPPVPFVPFMRLYCASRCPPEAAIQIDAFQTGSLALEALEAHCDFS